MSIVVICGFTAFITIYATVKNKPKTTPVVVSAFIICIASILTEYENNRQVATLIDTQKKAMDSQKRDYERIISEIKNGRRALESVGIVFSYTIPRSSEEFNKYTDRISQYLIDHPDILTRHENMGPGPDEGVYVSGRRNGEPVSAAVFTEELMPSREDEPLASQVLRTSYLSMDVYDGSVSLMKLEEQYQGMAPWSAEHLLSVSYYSNVQPDSTREFERSASLIYNIPDKTIRVSGRDKPDSAYWSNPGALTSEYDLVGKIICITISHRYVSASENMNNAARELVRNAVPGTFGISLDKGKEFPLRPRDAMRVVRGERGTTYIFSLPGERGAFDDMLR